MSCPLQTGYYTIQSTRDTPELYVGTEKPNSVTNVVVNNQKATFHFTLLGANPGCTYEISLGNPADKLWARHDKQWVNITGEYQQWILKQVEGNTYTIQLSTDENSVWTDLGPGSQPDRQIQLQPPQPGNSQVFRIITTT